MVRLYEKNLNVLFGREPKESKKAAQISRSGQDEEDDIEWAMNNKLVSVLPGDIIQLL